MSFLGGEHRLTSAAEGGAGGAEGERMYQALDFPRAVPHPASQAVTRRSQLRLSGDVRRAIADATKTFLEFVMTQISVSGVECGDRDHLIFHSERAAAYAVHPVEYPHWRRIYRRHSMVGTAERDRACDARVNSFADRKELRATKRLPLWNEKDPGQQSAPPAL